MLKDPVFNKANIIYRGRCSGSEFYVGYTKQNSEERWRVHCSNKKTPEVDECFLFNPDHTVKLGNIDKCSHSNRSLEHIASFLHKNTSTHPK